MNSNNKVFVSSLPNLDLDCPAWHLSLASSGSILRLSLSRTISLGLWFSFYNVDSASPCTPPSLRSTGEPFELWVCLGARCFLSLAETTVCLGVLSGEELWWGALAFKKGELFYGSVKSKFWNKGKEKSSKCLECLLSLALSLLIYNTIFFLFLLIKK